MLNTDEMRSEADDLEGGGNARLAGLLRDAADEIDAGRNARLVQYRCALVKGNAKWYSGRDGKLLSDNVEGDAHAMLAAERAPEVKR